MMMLGGILKDHWGAVGHDLTVAGRTWDDIGSERFPVDQFVSFVVHSPPGTATFHERSEGWAANEHLHAQAVDALNHLVWMKTADAQSKYPKHRPEPTLRPGMKRVEPVAAADKPMTVAEYAAKVGIRVSFDEEGG
jgi:Family of unknown function (DUF5361)